MNRYKLTSDANIIKRDDNALICANIDNRDYRKYVDWLAQGNTPDPIDPITPEQQRETLSSAVQNHLDTTAQTREYDSADQCASFANSTNPQWAADATVFVAWRDACWATYIAAVASEPYPTQAELIAALHMIVWPDA